MNEAAHRITRALQDAGYRAINPSMSFPMEMDRYPGRIWVVALDFRPEPAFEEALQRELRRLLPHGPSTD